MIQKLNKSCSGCYFEHNQTCYWFKLIQGSNCKPIPQKTFISGCKHYKNDIPILNDTINNFIKRFDGEIIGEKYEPPINRNDSYKKKYTTRHNYTERKDF
tara:strand:- start:168 stop:467 length:300 start_codon:yes stop_codon:yes gene_type:complete